MSSHFHYFQHRITKKAPAKTFELYWKETHESLMFISFRILIFFGAKYPNLSNTLCIVYEFLTGYHASDTYRHIKTGNWEHLNNKMSLFFHCLAQNDFCKSNCNENCFKVTDTASSSCRLKSKVLHKMEGKKTKPEVYSEPCQTSKAELFTKMVNGWKRYFWIHLYTG